jgi:hypothetical protein
MSSSDLEQQLTEAFQLEKDRKNPKLAETTFTIFLGNYDFSSIEAKKNYNSNFRLFTTVAVSCGIFKSIFTGQWTITAKPLH